MGAQHRGPRRARRGRGQRRCVRFAEGVVAAGGATRRARRAQPLPGWARGTWSLRKEAQSCPSVCNTCCRRPGISHPHRQSMLGCEWRHRNRACATLRKHPIPRRYQRDQKPPALAQPPRPALHKPPELFARQASVTEQRTSQCQRGGSQYKCVQEMVTKQNRDLSALWLSRWP